ncbi:MAG TPA: alcohol dehydrogenase catalytic domain-containing protein [Gaiellaceae bacterium]
MRAIVVEPDGEPRLRDVPEPEGAGDLVEVRACGLCGSDVEKLGPEAAGLVLGHEVVATRDGRLVALVHHLPCGECARCRAGHESTCERFRAATIEPGGLAERVRAAASVDLPDGIGEAFGTYAEPLACVLRAAERVPRGEVALVGGGFVGRLFREVLSARGDTAYVHDLDPSRDGPRAPGPVPAVVLCAPGGAAAAVELAEPGGTVVVFASGGPLDLDDVYRRELTVVGTRSATPRHMEDAVRLLPKLDLPGPTVLPLELFAEGLELYRSRRALKVVFTP